MKKLITTHTLANRFSIPHKMVLQLMEDSGVKPAQTIPWGQRTIRYWGKNAEAVLKLRQQRIESEKAARHAAEADAMLQREYDKAVAQAETLRVLPEPTVIELAPVEAPSDVEQDTVTADAHLELHRRSVDIMTQSLELSTSLVAALERIATAMEKHTPAQVPITWPQVDPTYPGPWTSCGISANTQNGDAGTSRPPVDLTSALGSLDLEACAVGGTDD